MIKTTRGARAAIAAGALGTALFAGFGPAAAQVQNPCDSSYCPPVTRPELTTTTAGGTTTTAGETTTTEAEETTTTVAGETTTTMAGETTTTATEAVDDAPGADPVEAQASYTG